MQHAVQYFLRVCGYRSFLLFESCFDSGTLFALGEDEWRSGNGSRKLCRSSQSAVSLSLMVFALLFSEASSRHISSLVSNPGLLPCRLRNSTINANVEHVSFARTDMLIDDDDPPSYTMHLSMIVRVVFWLVEDNELLLVPL